VGSRSQSFDGGKSRHAERSASNNAEQCRVIEELDKDFHKMQLVQGGKCKACQGRSRTMNLKTQQPLIGTIFTNADPRYAGKLDDKQGGYTIVTMKKVREAMHYFQCRVGGRVNIAVAHI